MKPSAAGRAPILPEWTGRLIACLLIAHGVWTLPLGFFLGFNTSRHPTWLKLLLGGAGIIGGYGIMRRRPWGRWLGIAFLLTQLVGMTMPGFDYQPVLSFGHVRFRFMVGGQPAELNANVAALLMIVALLARSAGAVRAVRPQ